MKYIVTENTIIFHHEGVTATVDKTYKHFEALKAAINDNDDINEILYILNKDTIDEALRLLKTTGGNLAI
jgi:hypothetical protein